MKRVFPNNVISWLGNINNKYFDGYALKSYSQEGEDMILRRLFDNQKTGFYVDVGAHHPKRFSNTYYFYKRGWKGINIDAMPGSMKLFNRVRPNDINIEKAISDRKEVLTYHMFKDPAVNTFNKKLSEESVLINKRSIITELEIEAVPLKNILDKYLPPNQAIDFISIDVEGLDIKVLNSNDWHKYRPRIVLVEDLDLTLSDLVSNDIYKFLSSINYKLIAKTVNTLIYETEF